MTQEVITVKQYHERTGMPIRTINNLLAEGKMPEGVKTFTKSGIAKTAPKLLFMKHIKKGHK